MCGRYAFDDTKEIFEFRMLLEEIADVFGEQAAASVKTGEVFPTDTAAVLAQYNDGMRAEPMAWGYLLSNSSRPIINARSETLLEKPLFRNSVLSQKALIPCTGFYEWQKTDIGKIKYHIQIKDSNFFYLAGLYRTDQLCDVTYNRFVIITAPANSAMREIHHRMPLMISKTDAAVWLNARENLGELIHSFIKETPPLSIINATR